MSEKRTLIGRDAGGVLDEGPSYFLEDGKLIWTLFGYEEERDPAVEIKALQDLNSRQGKVAETASLSGEWLPLARIKAREQLIKFIAETFDVEIPEPDKTEEADEEPGTASPCPGEGHQEEEAADETADN